MNADSSLDHLFFPDSGVVSVLAVYANGTLIEMATIGREGCTGVQAALGLWDGPASAAIAAFEFARARLTGEEPRLGENRKVTVEM